MPGPGADKGMEALEENRSTDGRARRGAAGPSSGRQRLVRAGFLLLPFAVLVAAVLFETSTSTLQSWILHREAARLTWSIAPGPSDRIRFPTTGPFDLRRGYVGLPDITKRLEDHNSRIAAQARMSPPMLSLMDHGLYPVYPEKTQAGLLILDREARPLYHTSLPERVYPSYDAIPPLVVTSLLYLENRALLDQGHPFRNPAVEWDRLIKATLDFALNHIGLHRAQPGGSTLATQIEKFRHSNEGRTDTAGDKVRQMLEASLRAYRDGRNTQGARRRIILDYVNSVPLAARSDYGEIQGLKDGLWVWYGADPARVDRILASPLDVAGAAAWGPAFREVLSLFIAQRRPSEFLLGGHHGLDREINSNLRLLARAGMISPEERDATLRARLDFRRSSVSRILPSFAEAKATNAIRARLLTLTGLTSFYDLDRLDLTVASTIDAATQKRVTRTLERLRLPSVADSLGLRGPQLLVHGDPGGVIYSFDLYEHTNGGNVLRVQADNLNQPLDINEGVKLELGSTAKLRTLCNYLGIIGDLHADMAGKPRSEIARGAVLDDDPIRKWAAGFLSTSPDTTLPAMLTGALNRTYSANPGEAFYTGGGLHVFQNFEHQEDDQTYTVRDGLVHSVNLVYIRLLRDIVRYYRDELPAWQNGILETESNPERAEYLAKFADKEGKEFLWGFYKKYKGLKPDEQLRALVEGIQPTPKRLAVIFRTVRPDATLDRFTAFLRASLPSGAPSSELTAQLYDEYAPGRFGLDDLGYLARVHPLELWLLEYLNQHPGANWKDVSDAGRDQRQEVYSWLFKSHRKAAQDKRIRDLLEEEAFERIHDAWVKLGYPFDRLVPSYATAIGSSADKPVALADLMGILVNDGMRYPLERLEQLRFAEGTPFETVFEADGAQPERVMRPEAARLIRSALFDVVGQGTAIRAKGALTLPNGSVIPIGGKTGTGDNRYETFAPGGRLISSKVINRTATFVFLIGDRFFGTVTAHVNGPDAADYVFTSALSAQLMKALAPDLLPMVSKPAEPGS